jgi:hypothetical protein
LTESKAPPKPTKKADCGTSESGAGGLIGLGGKSAAKAESVKTRPAIITAIAAARTCRMF